RLVAREAGPQGTFFVTLRPDAVEGPAEVWLDITTKGGVRYEERVSLPAEPTGGRLALSVDPPLLDGVEGTAIVRVQPAPGPLVSPGERRIALAASVGQVSVLSAARDGSYTAVYTPPDDLETPVAVLFTAVDLAAPEAVVGRA